MFPFKMVGFYDYLQGSDGRVVGGSDGHPEGGLERRKWTQMSRYCI